ncbi:DUF72 domain-containing protein [Aestuariivirga litoralis]|uniref:DUF72 domain-containing protein n=1 Tax=Aestuariivirga litoralis TaxID=2650924 RepID=UPI0018C7AE77|nr:DUF72 domain-containing protein [Aestuariivirga litoralis]MBG1230801.1 DUF72 domain-containing protein [Aestuariivirga litoralis]
MAKIRVGIGGWNFEEWRGTFYPKGLSQKLELKYASEHVTSIEINSTYYGSQKPDTFQKWHDETPDDFVFSVKAPRFATNRKILAEAAPSIEKFFESGVAKLGKKLGPINYQFSEYKKFEPDDFAKFLGLLPKSVDGVTLRHALEVRNAAFADKDFIAMAKDHNMAIVTSIDSDFPQINDVTADFVYVRIMGTKEKEPLGYSKPMLRKWATRATDWHEGKIPEGYENLAAKPDGKKRDVFFYVISGDKVRNPQAAMEIIKQL